MHFHSTAGRSAFVSFRSALLNGIAPDGGLYVPTEWPRFDEHTLAGWQGLSFTELAAQLSLRLLEDEFEPADLRDLAADALNFPAPTVPIGERRYVLELFHGPTLAFKDFGARFLARFFGFLLRQRPVSALVLVATSGDTGSAVAQGFHAVAGVEVVVLYPAGKVSRFQEAQMATLGGNIRAVRVPGTFDDCQRLVKLAFLDDELQHLHLSSANSINVGRLLPQMFYYVASYLSLAGREPRIAFSVPSGNLGNVTAGVLAERAGVPIDRFVASSNANDVLPEYLTTGVYRARPATVTLSTAMDVGDPSNFTRLLALHGGSLDSLRQQMYGIAISDMETRETIKRVYGESGYVLDPHAAVAYSGAEHMRRDTGFDGATVTLATAHPAKFGETIAAALGFEPELPPQHRDWRSRRSFAIDLADTRYDTFKGFLLGAGRSGLGAPGHGLGVGS